MNASSQVINAKDALPDFKPWDEQVQKIVLGDLDEQSTWEGLDQALFADGGLAKRFPNLTHLYLWRLAGVHRLPELPDKLAVLDVRDCPDLETVPELPATLERLILQDCPAVTALECAAAELPNLIELCLRGSANLSEASAQELVHAGGRLEVVDLSGLANLRSIERWPAAIVDLRLNDVPLRLLPAWPPTLRRLELRNTPLDDEAMPDLPDSIDYLDLGGMRRLRRLPENWRRVRTLFLCGSGVLVPPASEHGSAVDQNVARTTKEYFDECERVGRGQVKRCKVLILGNGGAGKTALSLRLTGGDPQRTRKDYEPEIDRIGTTHGVRFHDWKVQAAADKQTHEVHVHVWDFGGQEIYHNTHKLFLSAGTVFVIVWNPEEALAGGAHGPRIRGEYQDRSRPLAYWIEYVRQAAGPQAEILLVCSRTSEESAGLRDRIRAECGEHDLSEFSKIFYCDALARAGQLDELEQELRAKIAKVVTTQGTAVPATWELAQQLIEDWIHWSEADPDFEQAHRSLPRAQFHEALTRWIADSNRNARFPLLKKLVAANALELEDRRFDHLLAFLSHSGWVYWAPDLFEGRIIVGQKWALRGIYTLLERGLPGQPPVFARLTANHGMFRMRDLVEWGWDRLVPLEAERELLISFMQRIGLCFPLIEARNSWFDETTYLSLTHLPRHSDLTWKEMDPATLSLDREQFHPQQRSVEHSGLHQAHWDGILRWLGEQFGREGQYARDGFQAVNAAGQAIVLELDLGSKGFGGSIRVRVFGTDAESTADSLAEKIGSYLADAIGRRRVVTNPVEDAGGKRGVRSVFISYAWDPQQRGSSPSEAPAGYEVPVDAICERLRESDREIELLRDRYVLEDGDSIPAYNLRIEKADKVVVVHSDKYWRSQWCMHELSSMFHGLAERSDGGWKKVLVLIAHRLDGVGGNPLRVPAAKKGILDSWKAQPDLLPALETVTTSAKLAAAAVDLIENTVPRWAAAKSLEIVWDEGRRTQLLEEIAKRILD
ncbi:MAG: COR domain-containing protein [Planctomycetota bacterium]